MTIRTTLRLLAADLHYPEELQVHTAISGPIKTLASRYLSIERSDGFSGVGEVRANIAYLTKLPEEAVAPAIVDLCGRLPWSDPAQAILHCLPTLAPGAPPIARAAVECALLDGIARMKGIPVAELLGGAWRPAVRTNQCLFWSPDDRFERLARRYVGEGFRDLKVRIGIGSIESDVARLGRLRELFGDRIVIAVDVNGAWTADEAIEKLQMLERFHLSYVEQPTRPGDWRAFEKALATSATPLMLDESLVEEADIERLVQIGPKALAHLKIVKLGGPTAVMRAARRLAEAGVGVMIGQMNEGALATAMTAHCAMAARPEHAELYGCYGLVDDVAEGLAYVDGEVALAKAPGLGVSFDPTRCRTLWVEHAP